MEVQNKLNPSEEQILDLFKPGAEGPIFMVNLLKFKEKAEYADGRETDLTGAEAYRIYGAAVSKLLTKFGASGIYSGMVERLMVGEVEELWDMVGVVMYPNRQAMMDMLQSEEYQAIHVHRDAGLAGQLNIETTIPPSEWLAAAKGD